MIYAILTSTKTIRIPIDTEDPSKVETMINEAGGPDSLVIYAVARLRISAHHEPWTLAGVSREEAP